METAILFDCEFLVAQGAQARYWCGPFDPDPVIAQIGAVKISLNNDFEILDTFRVFVKPLDRFGTPYDLDPFFTKLTGITNEMIVSEGRELGAALKELDEFSSDAKLWSWGKDEFNMIAISCYVSNIAPLIPAKRFDNACKLFLNAGMPYEDMKKTRSNMLADYFSIEHPPLRGHDALDDALSVAYVVQHFLRTDALKPTDFN